MKTKWLFPFWLCVCTKYKIRCCKPQAEGKEDFNGFSVFFLIQKLPCVIKTFYRPNCLKPVLGFSTVVGDYIYTMKTNFVFNFYLYQHRSQTQRSREKLSIKKLFLITCNSKKACWQYKKSSSLYWYYRLPPYKNVKNIFFV